MCLLEYACFELGSGCCDGIWKRGCVGRITLAMKGIYWFGMVMRRRRKSRVDEEGIDGWIRY